MDWNVCPQGEDICAAAIREVKEETGVSCKIAISVFIWICYANAGYPIQIYI